MFESHSAVHACVVHDQGLRIAPQQSERLHLERAGTVVVQGQPVGDALHLILRQGQVEADALLRPFAVALQIVLVALQVGLLRIAH
ncbi:hypothetical protein GALL_451080 [mine drainage metagenome]|uniref:Uncharacterized protein n=1 Tax=mine drainage metagenome TaxID=410659 RepID=A0A1J5PZQ1_9ZZZZ